MGDSELAVQARLSSRLAAQLAAQASMLPHTHPTLRMLEAGVPAAEVLASRAEFIERQQTATRDLDRRMQFHLTRLAMEVKRLPLRMARPIEPPPPARPMPRARARRRAAARSPASRGDPDEPGESARPPGPPAHILYGRAANLARLAATYTGHLEAVGRDIAEGVERLADRRMAA
jgi:hypothetical protein